MKIRNKMAEKEKPVVNENHQLMNPTLDKSYWPRSLYNASGFGARIISVLRLLVLPSGVSLLCTG